MSPLEAQIILDELRKLHKRFDKRFDESDAKMERCFSRTPAVLEQRGDAVELRMGGSEQFGATQLVMADNWSGLFDGDDNSVTAGADAPVVADNWGGLFVDNPAFFPTRDATSTDSDAPPLASASGAAFGFKFSCTNGEVASTERVLEFHLDPVEYALPANLADPTWTSPHLHETVATLHVLVTGEPEYIPAFDKELEVDEKVPPSTGNEMFKADVQFSADQILRPAYDLLVPPSSIDLHTERPRDSALTCASLTQRTHKFDIVLGGSEFACVGVDIKRHHNDFTPDDPGLLHCVRLGPVECVLCAALLGGYDRSLDDDPKSGVAYFDVPHDRAVGRVGQASAAAAAYHADAVGTAGGGLRAWVVAAGSAQVTCSTICPTCDRSFADVPVCAFWDDMLHWNDDSGTIPTNTLPWLMKVAIARHGEASSLLLLWAHGTMHARATSITNASAQPSSSDLLADASRTHASIAGGKSHTVFLQGGMPGITMSIFLSREPACGSAHKIFELVSPATIHHHGPVAASYVRPEQKVTTPVILKHARLEFGEMPSTHTTIHSADTVQFRPTTWPPRWLSFDPSPVFKLEQHCSSKCVSLQHALPLLHSLACRFCSMGGYDLMNWFFNYLWKLPWFSFRYYQVHKCTHSQMFDEMWSSNSPTVASLRASRLGSMHLEVHKLLGTSFAHASNSALLDGRFGTVIVGLLQNNSSSQLSVSYQVEVYVAISMDEVFWQPSLSFSHSQFAIGIASMNSVGWQMPVTTLDRDLMPLYGREKDALHSITSKTSGGLSFVVDKWRSQETSNDDIYPCVTACLVDAGWKLQRGIMGFTFMEFPDDVPVLLHKHIDKENMLSVMLGDNQHQPWPPPEELRMTTYDAKLGSVLWPLFNMIERCSVMCQTGCIWKPPWPVLVSTQLRVAKTYIDINLDIFGHMARVVLVMLVLQALRWLQFCVRRFRNLKIVVKGNISCAMSILLLLLRRY